MQHKGRKAKIVDGKENVLSKKKYNDSDITTFVMSKAPQRVRGSMSFLKDDLGTARD